MHPRILLMAPLLLLLACDDGPDGGNGEGSTGGAESTSSTTAETSGAAESSGSESDASTSSSDPSTSGGPSTSSTSAASTGTEGEAESSTGEVPTSGPGVLPGETGVEAMCRRVFECGGSYYADEDACIDAGVDYWGECAEVTAALDAFGACMSEVPCDEYDPDAYNPASTPCSEEWSDLGEAGPC